MNRFKAFRLTQVERRIEAEFADSSIDDLDPGEVLIKVAYSDVNYKDALAATGKGRILLRPSCIGGIDLSGTVESSTDRGFSAGDEVLAVGHGLGVNHHGGYAEFARVPAGWVVKRPAGLSAWDAMAFGTAGYTAGLAVVKMEHCGLRPDLGPVVVDGATGGVGSIAIATLAKRGYHVVALTGKENESAWLRRLGANEILLRQSIDPERTRPLDKARWAGAVDNLGGEVLAWMASTMKVNGVIASIGLAASHALNTTVMPFILRGVTLLGINSIDAPSAALEREVWARLAGDLRPPLLAEMARTIEFDQLPGVFDDFIASRISRRVVVRIGA